MEKKHFDVVIIGAGPGGYVAAIRLSQAGKNVCLIDEKELGGTCLNIGCIPTKTLIAGAELMHHLRGSEELGIHVSSIEIDYAKMKARKDRVVEKIRKSLGGLLQANKITVLQGRAEFTSPTELKVIGKDSLYVSGANFIIATGSIPLDIPAFPCDHQRVLNSTSILEMTTLPKRLAVIGGGYIGCEFASLFAELGVEVTILEALPAIVSLQGKAVSDALTGAFTKRGIKLLTSVMVEGIDKKDNHLEIRLKDKPSIETDIALVSIGRKVASHQLGLDKAGVKTGEKGEILVDDQMRTHVPHIFAIGDVTGKFLLAHVASHQGVIAADTILGRQATMHYHAVPAVIFTLPEIATVGMTLEEAEKAGYAATTGKFPFMALGKSIASNEPDGFAQVVIDKKTRQILGAQIVGSHAASLISEMAVAIQNELTAESIAETIHAHPTLPEAWHEAALLAMDMPLHLPPKRKL